MKRLVLLLIIVILVLSSCHKKRLNVNYREQMRLFVEKISQYAKDKKPLFYIIPQNGVQLVVRDETSLEPDNNYLSSIDGVGQEDLFYGYDADDKATPKDQTEYLLQFLNIVKDHGKKVLITDYCYTHSKIDDSYKKNDEYGFCGFAAPERDLNVIPDYPSEPHNVNNLDIRNLDSIRNFLYIINPENFSSIDDMISQLQQTNYDMLLIDLFFNGKQLTRDQVQALKTKANGGKRLVIAYMSIGEAEDYRYYWKPEWKNNPPQWLENENPQWQGNYKVRYWDPQWQKIIFGTKDSYLDKILESDFDGVYLDIIDAFEYFEQKYQK